MNKDKLAIALGVVMVLLVGYLAGVYIVAFDNSMTLSDNCTKSGHTWIADPLTFGATGECK